MKILFSIITLFLAIEAFALEAPTGFKKESVTINGVKFNVYKGGQGEPLLLLHGYAQSSLMWSKAMIHFKDKFMIIAPDLRGAGQSAATESGYEKTTMAKDMKMILDHYKITNARVVGHDVGLMVAYALAATYPQTVNQLVLMDAFVPGVGPGDDIYNSPNIWHFRFNGKYPEKLVQGRERIFFDSLWEGFSAKQGTFPEASKKHYLAEYSRPGRMKAGFEYFKAMPTDAITNKKLSQTKLSMPVMSMGGDKSLGQAMAETVKVFSNNPTTIIVKNCGHWMMEECPQETLKALESFLTSSTYTRQAEEQQ